MTSERKFLSLRNIYGINSLVHSNVHFLPLSVPSEDGLDQAEQTLVAHVCGNTVTIHFPTRGTPDFHIVPGPRCASISCLHVFRDRKYFAIGCRAAHRSQKGAVHGGTVGSSNADGMGDLSSSGGGGGGPGHRGGGYRTGPPGGPTSPAASRVKTYPADPDPFLQIYDIASDFRLCRTLSMTDSPLGSSEILCIDRSKDNKVLIIQGGAPEYKLAIWLFVDAVRPKKPLGVLRVLANIQSGGGPGATGGNSTPQVQMQRNASGVVVGVGSGVGTQSVGSGIDEGGEREMEGEVGGGGGGGGGIGTGTGTSGGGPGGPGTGPGAGDPVVYCSSIAPNGRIICVTGERLFRLYKIEDTAGWRISVLKRELNLPPTENRSLLSHMWLDNAGNRLLVTNGAGSIFLVEEGEFRKKLDSSPSNHLSINTIIPYEKAFLIGGEDGHLTAFEKSEERGQYKKVNFVKLPNENERFSEDDMTVVCLDYDPSNCMIVCGTKAGQIFMVQMTGWAHLRDAEVEQLSPFHTMRITGVDTAQKKPFIATCGQDRTVRVFNYHSQTVEVFRKFEMEACSLSMHPTGFYLLVGFADKLRFFKILGNELREETSFAIRSCSEVKFSNGGQYFAAVHGTAVHVYCSYTYQHLFSLRNAHTAKVTSIFWNADDTRISSVDANGTVVEFLLRSETKIWHHALNTYLFDVVSNQKSTFVVGRDSKIHVFMEHVHLNEYSLPLDYSGRKDIRRTSLTALAVSPYSKLLFAGREDGSVWVYNQGNVQSHQDVHFCHTSSITHLRTTHRGQMLVVVSLDGSMALYEIWERDRDRLGLEDEILDEAGAGIVSLRRRKRQRRVASVIEDWDDEILIEMPDLQAKVDQIREYQMMCDDLQSNNEYNQVKKQLEYDAKVKKESEEYAIELQKKNQLIKDLEQQIAIKESNYQAERKKKMEMHRKEVSELEAQCNDRIAATLTELQEVETSKQSEIRRLVERGDEEDFVNEEDYRRVIEEHKKQVDELQNQIKEFHEQKEKCESDHDLFLRLLKEEHRQSIERMVEDYERRLRKEQIHFERLTKESMRRVSSEREYELERNELQAKIDRTQRELQRKNAELIQRNHETESIKRENEEREKTIEQKKRRIEELTKQNRELNKFRFVLNYKIETLQNEINPNRETIAAMERDLTKYKRELDRYGRERDTLKYRIRDLNRKIHGNSLELRKLKARSSELDSFKTRMRSDIHEVFQHIRDNRLLKQRTVDFYHKYAAPEPGSGARVDFDLRRENDRRRTHLERNVESLKKKLVKATRTSKQGTMRIMDENVMLINEINNLRKELRFLRRRLHAPDVSAAGAAAAAESSPDVPSADGQGMGSTMSLRDAVRQWDMQKMHIQALRNKLETLDRDRRRSRRGYSSGRSSGRPPSRLDSAGL